MNVATGWMREAAVMAEKSLNAGAEAEAAASAAEEKLRKVCADFESVFVFMMMKTMRAAVPKSGLLDAYPGRETYTMLMDQKVAEDLTRKGDGIGLQAVMYRYLTRGAQTNPEK